MSNLPENWRPVIGWESLYEVSSCGRVRSFDHVVTFPDGRSRFSRGRIRKTGVTTKYELVTLCGKGVQKTETVHSLVAAAFIGPRPEGMVVNHKNGEKYDNRSENLEYVTPKENHAHARDSLGCFLGERNGGAKLCEDQVKEARRRFSNGETKESIAKEYGVTASAIDQLVRRIRWKHVA